MYTFKKRMLLLLNRFSRIQLRATPQTAAHQAPPSLGFSRQEHWSELPFPSPVHENEKWKGSHSVVSDSSCPHGLQPTRLLCPWNFPGNNNGVGGHFLLQELFPTQGVDLCLPHCQVGSMPLCHLEAHSMVWIYHNLPTHPTADGHFGCFQCLATANKAAMNTSVQFLYRRRL